MLIESAAVFGGALQLCTAVRTSDAKIRARRHPRAWGFQILGAALMLAGAGTLLYGLPGTLMIIAGALLSLGAKASTVLTRPRLALELLPIPPETDGTELRKFADQVEIQQLMGVPAQYFDDRQTGHILGPSGEPCTVCCGSGVKPA